MNVNPGFPLEIVQGADLNWTVTYLDASGSPINLTGYSAKMQIRVTSSANSPALIDVSTTNGYISITPTTGIISITIPNSLTAALVAPMQAVYDLFITSGSQFKTRLVYGSVSIVARVTQ